MGTAFAFKYDDEEVLKGSSSGGAFFALSNYILENDGIVYGAVYDFENNNVIHTRANNIRDRERMKGSKYLQSKIGDTFFEVSKDLEKGRQVLFSGTMCQVVALKKYLSAKNISIDKLLTCDIICHGVASPLIWKQYIEYKSPQKLKFINFRSKELGWMNSKAIAQNDVNKIDLSDYMKLYYSHTIMRPSCHTCGFSSTVRQSEITIGDFWGIEKLDLDFNYNNGLSFVMANNEKGKLLLENTTKFNAKIKIREVNINDVKQPNFYSPTRASVIRERLWKDYRKKGISYILKKYTSDALFCRILVFLQKVMDSIFNKKGGLEFETVTNHADL